MTFQDKPLFGKANFSFKHGMSGTRTWKSWRAMHKRVNGTDSYSYLYVNVKICKRWRGKNGFKNFLKDMGERPAGRTIDRFPNRKGDYKLSNCRWATPKEQAANSEPRKIDLIYKNARLISHNGKTQTLFQWSRLLGVSPQMIRYRLKVGIPLPFHK